MRPAVSQLYFGLDKKIFSVLNRSVVMGHSVLMMVVSEITKTIILNNVKAKFHKLRLKMCYTEKLAGHQNHVFIGLLHTEDFTTEILFDTGCVYIHHMHQHLYQDSHKLYTKYCHYVHEFPYCTKSSLILCTKNNIIITDYENSFTVCY